jgi:cellulose biosynthesis protein BcsQ
MAVSKILVADNDLEYGKALARAVSGLQNELEITVICPSRNKSKKASGDLFTGYDLILLGGCEEAILHAVKSQVSDSRIVILSESVVETLTEQSKKEEKQFWQIYKYSNVYEIIADLNFLIGSLTGKKSLSRKSLGPELIGFYGISGGAGKSVVAISTLRELSRYHDKKTLYLCFEEIPATELFVINNSSGRNIGDYLYYLFERKNEVLCSRPEAFTACDEFGVEYLYPSKGRNDLAFLTQNEIVLFLKTVSESCRYDYIALDLKNDLAEETLFLMNLCSKIIFIRSENRVSELKSRKCMDYLLQHNALENIERVLSVVNKAAGPEGEKGEDPNIFPKKDTVIYIEEDENSFRFAPTHIDVALDHNFGIGIKKVADRILLTENAAYQKGGE